MKKDGIGNDGNGEGNNGNGGGNDGNNNGNGCDDCRADNNTSVCDIEMFPYTTCHFCDETSSTCVPGNWNICIPKILRINFKDASLVITVQETMIAFLEDVGKLSQQFGIPAMIIVNTFS